MYGKVAHEVTVGLSIRPQEEVHTDRVHMKGGGGEFMNLVLDELKEKEKSESKRERERERERERKGELIGVQERDGGREMHDHHMPLLTSTAQMEHPLISISSTLPG